MCEVVVAEADEEVRDLDGLMTAAEVKRSGLWGKFCELHTECRAVLTKVLSGLVDVVKMTKPITTREEKPRKSDREFQKTQREFQIASGPILKAPKRASSEAEEARSCRQQLEGVDGRGIWPLGRSQSLKGLVTRLLLDGMKCWNVCREIAT